MEKINIENLPKNMKIGREELRMIRGGKMDPPPVYESSGTYPGHMAEPDYVDMVIWLIEDGIVATADKYGYLVWEKYRQ